MEANGEDVRGDTIAVWDLCAHVHVSDCDPPPATLERPFPGGGQADQTSYLGAVVAQDYQGPIILEGHPWKDKAECLVESREPVERLLTELGAAQ